MAGESSSSPCVVMEIGGEYPYPSHVCAPNFVTVKMSGKDMYGSWKTQMVCLLEGHGMLGFVNETPRKCASGKEKLEDYKLWRRSDALVKGWILGSLSEHTLRYVVNIMKKEEDFTAKDVWDKLQSIYGPPSPLLQQPDHEEEIITREEESAIQKKSTAEGAKPNNKATKKEEEDKKKKIKAARERAEVHQSLYQATLRQNFVVVARILSNKEVAVTVNDKITINGNTALHVAVGTTKEMEFIRKMLFLAENKKLMDIRNSDGSTLLHVAAIVGNLGAAKILVEKNQDLLFAKDHEGHTPLARALANMHTDTYLYLLEMANTLDVEMGTYYGGGSGDELMVNAISSKDFASAMKMSWRHDNLSSDAVLMAIAQNFPRKPNIWERAVHKIIRPPKNKEPMSYKTLNAYCNILQSFLIYTCCLGEIFLFLFGVIWGIYKLLRYLIKILLKPFKYINERAKMHQDATKLLKSLCQGIQFHTDSSSHHYCYNNPVLEAARQNAYEVVVLIVSYFPNAIWSTNEDGHNIIQYAVINRSEQVYNLLYQMSEHKNVYKTIKDPFENNLFHLAAKLAPPEKLNHISGAALQIQRELQWFKEVEGFVCPLNIIQKNSFGETPQMVFTREHKELVIEGEKWIKATAESYTITAALITTIVFAAAITVPGGNNQDTGIPIFTNDKAFTIFAVSDAISLFTSVTSLLMFLSIFTTRFAEQDFLFKLPTKLIIGLGILFISASAMIIAFGATLFLVFGQRKSWIVIPIAALTCLPITSFVTLQFPLIADLVSSTYGRSIFGKKRNEPFY